MKTLHEERDCWCGTDKGCAIEIEREPDGRFYIIVRHTDGGLLYDGWAPDEVDTLAAAKREALFGACLRERPA